MTDKKPNSLPRVASIDTPKLTEQQVADMLAESDLVTEFGHRTLINGEPMHARLNFLTSFVNYVLVAHIAHQAQAGPIADLIEFTERHEADPP